MIDAAAGGDQSACIHFELQHYPTCSTGDGTSSIGCPSCRGTGEIYVSQKKQNISKWIIQVWRSLRSVSIWHESSFQKMPPPQFSITKIVQRCHTGIHQLLRATHHIVIWIPVHPIHHQVASARTAGLLQKLQQQQRKNNGVIIHDFKFDTRNYWKPIGFEGPLISDKLKFSNNSCSILLMLLCFCARWFFSLLLTLEKWKCTQLTKPIAGLSWGQGNLPKSNRSTAWTSNPGRRVNPHPRCSRSSVSEQWCRPLALASSSALPAGLGAIAVPKRTWFTPD